MENQTQSVSCAFEMRQGVKFQILALPARFLSDVCVTVVTGRDWITILPNVTGRGQVAFDAPNGRMVIGNK